MTRIIITGRNCDVPQRAFSGHPHLVTGSQPVSAARRNLAWPGGVIPCSPPGHPEDQISPIVVSRIASRRNAHHTGNSHAQDR